MVHVWQESSVEKFGAVHTKVMEAHNEEETTRGASLRELTQFFKEKDQHEGYAGLRRIADEDGTAVWTILKETEVTTKLEERTKERKQEERRRDDLFGAYAQLHAPSETTGAASTATGTKAEAAEAERVRVVADAGEKAAEEKAAVSPAAVATTKGGGNGGDDGKNSESDNSSTSRPALMTVGDHGCGVVCGLQ